jgi:hypothetical protein
MTLKRHKIAIMEYQRITLRIPTDLHKQLMEKSEQKSRSMNAEIIARLIDSLNLPDDELAPSNDEHIRRIASEVLKEELAKLTKAGIKLAD